MSVLIDSNVLLDVLTEDRRWSSWSAEALADQAERDVLAVTPIIYAEVSIGFDRIKEFDAALPAATFHRLPLPWEAAFLAGTASAAELGQRRCQTSTSVLTPASRAWRC